MCRVCRNKGSLGKRLFKLELECARANEQQLASERLLEERQRIIDGLLEDKQRLTREREAVMRRGETSPVQQQSEVHVSERVSVTQSKEPNATLQLTSGIRSDEHSSESETEDSNTSQNLRTPSRYPRRLVQLLGFKEIRSRVGKFSSRKGDEDFGLWLADFEETTDDFTWSSDTRAKWFSWFVEGPAKATWQRTLSAEERGSCRVSIKKIFQGQYGTHMDPRTAYLRCHELQYEELGSVQALLEGMREYQRLAPDKLSDTNLESILWNKVPVTLQKEVGEMKEWSLQELFQRLLKAEARVQERERQQQSVGTGQPENNLNEDMKKITVDTRKKLPTQTRSASYKPSEFTQAKSRTYRDKPTGEMQAKSMKRFNCNEKGHFASSCPKAKKSSFRVSMEGNQETTSEIQTSDNQTLTEEITLWTRVLTFNQSDEQHQPRTHTVGPIYKVNMTVGGIPTRAFLDHGSQITIIRRQLLPKIRDKRGWSDQQCIAKTNCKEMGAQPVGAMGKELGTCGIVVLQMEIDETGQNLEIPCYVLDSVKPLWQGELKDCAVLLETNALTDFGFEVVYPNGTPIHPVYKDQANTSNEKSSLKIVLKKSIHLKPGCTKLVPATVDGEIVTPPQVNCCGIISRNAAVLAANNCDFPEELWNGQKDLMISLTNWGNMPVLVKKQSQVGEIERTEFVAKDDPHWKVEFEANARVCHISSEDKSEQLREQLKIGDAVSDVQKMKLVELLLRHGAGFRVIF